MKKFKTLLCVVTMLLGMSACGGDSTSLTIDGGLDRTPDGSMTNQTPDGGSTADAQVPGSCDISANLNTEGTPLSTGTGRTFHGDNSSASAEPRTDITSGSCVLFGDDVISSYELIFSYTAQTDGYIVASTDDPATDPTLDTMMWILDGCSTTAMELGCDDDVDYSGGNTRSTVATARQVTAGTTVFIVVGGFAAADGETTSHGAFTLNVLELAPHGADEACDENNPFCVDGHTCVESAEGSTCVRNGTNNAPCNDSEPFCDTGLACSNDEGEPGFCQVPIATGEVCSIEHFVCVEGSACITDPGSEVMGHCNANGANNGLCRTTGEACDDGLRCSNPEPGGRGFCQVPIATGEVCTNNHFVCVEGSTCVPDDDEAETFHCLVDGSENGACRLSGSPCDAELTCEDTGLCK